MSTTERHARHAWLGGAPLYCFDLPSDLIQSLVLRQSEEDGSEQQAQSDDAQRAMPSGSANKSRIGSLSCSMCPGCGAFDNVQQQRSHFRSLWHRYNLVVRQHNLRWPSAQAPLVTRDELEQMCASMEHENDKGDEDAAPDELTALIRRLDVASHDSEQSEETENHARTVSMMSDALRSPIWWYETVEPADMQLEQTQLGLYRDVLMAAAPSDAKPSKYLAALATPRLTMRPGTYGWAGKRLQGTHHVGRAMQMHVLDGAGLVPTLEEESESDDTETESDTTSQSSEASDVSEHEEVPPSLPPLPALRLWTFVMLGGGHFAVATVALNLHVAPLSERAKARGRRPERSIIVLAHKTFHRYTTRRKQGGSQAAQDATGRHAKSAGANLRRYGEAQLTQDIHALLSRRQWRELISRSEHVWVRASMRTAHGVLWQWQGHAESPLDAKQASGALSHIPIATQRPTLSEILRCFLELTRVKVAHLTPEELAAQDDAHREAMARALRASDAQQHSVKPQPARPERQNTSAQHDARVRERWERLVTMVRRGKLDALANFVQQHAHLLEEAMQAEDAEAYADAKLVDAPLPLWWRQSEARTGAVPTTLLQLAAISGQADVVHYLLVEQRADPTLPVLGSTTHRTAYDLCPSKATRAVFRRLMAEQPTWWAWDEMGPGGARVPSALTAEMADAQASKARNRRTAMREKIREREAKQQAAEADAKAKAEKEAEAKKEAEASAKSSTLGHLWQRLGGRTTAPSDDSSLSDDMRRRIEREKRARAAEARMRKS